MYTVTKYRITFNLMHFEFVEEDTVGKMCEEMRVVDI